MPNVSGNILKLKQPPKSNVINEVKLPNVSGKILKLKQPLKSNVTNEVKLPNVSGNPSNLSHLLKFIIINEVKLPNVSGVSFKFTHSLKFNVTNEVRLPNVSGNIVKFKRPLKSNEVKLPNVFNTPPKYWLDSSWNKTFDFLSSISTKCIKNDGDDCIDRTSDGSIWFIRGNGPGTYIRKKILRNFLETNLNMNTKESALSKVW